MPIILDRGALKLWMFCHASKRALQWVLFTRTHAVATDGVAAIQYALPTAGTLPIGYSERSRCPKKAYVHMDTLIMVGKVYDSESAKPIIVGTAPKLTVPTSAGNVTFRVYTRTPDGFPPILSPTHEHTIWAPRETNFSIRADPKYLNIIGKMFSGIGSDPVTLAFTDERSPITVSDDQGNSAQVMPIATTREPKL